MAWSSTAAWRLRSVKRGSVAGVKGVCDILCDDVFMRRNVSSVVAVVVVGGGGYGDDLVLLVCFAGSHVVLLCRTFPQLCILTPISRRHSPRDGRMMERTQAAATRADVQWRRDEF